MANGFAVDKTSPAEIARNAMVGIEAGDENIDADASASQGRAGMRDDPEGVRTDVWLRAAEFRAKHPLT